MPIDKNMKLVQIRGKFTSFKNSVLISRLFFAVCYHAVFVKKHCDKI